jgi:hypothetical protein
MSLDPGWIALAASVMGGVGLKVAEHWLGRNKVRIDDATQIRDELRKEIAALREENRLQEIDLIKWREEYFALRERLFRLETALTLALSKIKDEQAAAEIKAQVPDLPTLTEPGKS